MMRIVSSMQGTKVFLLMSSMLLAWGSFTALGQTFTEYKFIFKGMAYQTNAAGNLVGTPITDQTFLQNRASEGGITDFSTVAIVYHIGGNASDSEPGDTVDVIYTNNPAALTTEFNFWFGNDGGLGRIGVTNAAQSEVWEADYIYTQDKSTYTFDNNDSVGLCLTHKVNITPTNGFTNTIITGDMSWGVAPQTNNQGIVSAPIVCIGTFSLGQPLY